jgi:hypothetical protein
MREITQEKTLILLAFGRQHLHGGALRGINHNGATREFPAIMHYYEPEKAWVLNDLLPTAFMDEFGRGELLTIRNARGDKVIDFDLKGAGKARETVRRVCRM